jgi:hypothetical protein
VKAASAPLVAVLVLVSSVGGPSIASASSAQAPVAPQHYEPWSFGVMPDTQWTVADDGYNPNTIAANIVKQVDKQFINAGVKFVVAVGDMVDQGTTGPVTNIDVRALYAQDLYNAGIGFYPLRGNHEANEGAQPTLSGTELRYAFPQIGTGVNNNTPAAITTGLISPTTDLANNPPAAKTGSSFIVGTDFTEPVSVNTANNSVSYAFRYNNATFMLLDQFDVNGDYYNSTIPQQQQWISNTLSSRPAGTQAFVFTHKNLLGGNHKDNLFGGPITKTDPGDGVGVITATLSIADQQTLAAKQAAENAFIASMQANNVPFVITGHDHQHYASYVSSPDGQSHVHQLIGASESTKFYIPTVPTSTNDLPIQQELGRVGYYIVTVDGPRTTIDYYGDVSGGSDYGLNGAAFHFAKISSMHYSLNGKEKVVEWKGSYNMADDTTKAATLENGFLSTRTTMVITGTFGAGTNGTLPTTNTGTRIWNDVTTGWKPASSGLGLASDILSLNGMNRSLGSEKTDEYVLSMSYVTPSGIPSSTLNTMILSGTFGLITKDSSGRWMMAGSHIYAINPKFVVGPYNPSYKLGTYGIYTPTNTAWAVVNYNGDFAVGSPSTLILPAVYRH